MILLRSLLLILLLLPFPPSQLSRFPSPCCVRVFAGQECSPGSPRQKHAATAPLSLEREGRRGSSRSECLGLLDTCNGSLDSKLLKPPFPSPLLSSFFLRLFCRRFVESSLLFLSPFSTYSLRHSPHQSQPA